MEKSIDRFYEITKNFSANDNVKKFINLGIKPGIAVDLGCGTGRDIIFLIRNGWTVIGIDSNNVERYIVNKLSDTEKMKFKFINEKFEEIEIIKNDLIVANNSLPFCHKMKFNKLWNKISDSIKKERIFCWYIFRRKRFLE